MRSVANGNETVPTVLIDGRAFVNPAPRQVVAAILGPLTVSSSSSSRPVPVHDQRMVIAQPTPVFVVQSVSEGVKAGLNTARFSVVLSQ